MQGKRASNIEVKRINRNQVYWLINQRERVSKPEIAAALGLSMPTVLQNVDELIERDLIVEAGTFESTGGRKAKVLTANYAARFAIGIDITQNHVGLALTDLSGDVCLHRRLQKPFTDQEQYYRELGELAMAFLKETGRPVERFLGFGISIPGIVSLDGQTITHSHALGVAGVPCRRFYEFIPYPCVLTNDANAAMIAEMYHNPSPMTAIYFSLSNYVGGAIFTQAAQDFDHRPAFDRLFLGDHCRSGEFGHMTLFPAGTQCYCGKLGCVDSYCSAKLLASRCAGKLETFFFELESDPTHLAVWNRYLDHLAIAVNSLRMAFDSPVIIGGYVGSFMEPYLSDLQQRASLLNTFGQDASYIRLCQFKVEASALGAALRHIEAFIQTI